MAVVPFPKSNPRTQDTLSVVYALCSQFPKWIIEHERADDGMPYVTAKQRLTGAVLGAHHGPDGWAVLNERWQVVTRSPDLRTALEHALG